MTWIYRKLPQGNDNYLYTVGYYYVPPRDNRPTWFSDEDFSSIEKARQRVNYLNGGRGLLEGV